MGKQSNRQLHKLAAHVCCCLLTASLHGIAHSQALAPVPLPSFAELEAAGASIGEIRVLAQDIFDTADPHEDKLLFRWANALHMQTRPDVIRRSLLFKPGEPVSLRLIEETERLLRSKRYLYDVELRPTAVHDGVVDIDVLTRDTWSLDPGFSLGRSGGSNSGGIRLHEYNLLGSGTAISLGHSRMVDRSSNELQFFGEHLLGGWTSVALSLASNSDGRRQAVSIARPFYALDTRWAAGVSASKDERIDAFYNAGEISSQYRHQQDLAEVFAGWSDGLQQAWVQRFVLGLNLRDDRYAQAEGMTAPAPALFPRDEKLVTPFVRYSLIEDRFDRVLNRNLIGRPEYFALGLVSSVQLGYASTGLGSSLQGLVYAASVSRGFEPAARQTLIASATLSGQYVDGRVRRQQLGAQAQYYLQQSPRWLFYAAATGALQTNPEPVDALLLGGDNGLRGYPLRYQSGSRSALFTVEERFYTDLYIWRLFRLGGAAFVDVGRAWGGVNTNSVNPGWLADIGFGARIVSARAAFSNVLHLDLAFPLNATADIKKVQFLVKTKTSF